MTTFTDRHHRLAAEILKRMAGQQFTQQDAADQIGVSRGMVCQAIQILRDSDSVHIVDYRGDRLVSVYKLGAGQDAPKPSQINKLLALRGDEMLAELSKRDLTALQLMKATGMKRDRVHLVLHYLHEHGRIHIHAYSEASNFQAAIWRAGAGQDASKTKEPRPAAAKRYKIPPRDPLVAALFGNAP